MSESSERGKSFEMRVSKMIRLKIDKHAKRNAGSHANFHRRSDIYTSLPIHIEAKDHETLRPKEWFRQAEEAAFGKTPVVAFQMEAEVMVMLKFDDLLNLFVEIADQKLEIEDLRKPTNLTPLLISLGDKTTNVIPDSTLTREFKVCPQGHIVDQWGYCQTKNCKFNRTYKPPKIKNKS